MGRTATRGRAGVAGIIATVIMFAILFTVGGSYLAFEQGNYNTFVRNQVARLANYESAQSEGLVVTTKLVGLDIGFFVNNTGGVTVNMTAVLVLSSTGSLLKCDGKGLPAGASCGNTASPNVLPVLVNPGKGSAVMDTGYVWGVGTVDTVKIITARGSIYSATYPSTQTQNLSNQVNAQVAISVGSLLINQQSFRFYSDAVNNLGDGYIVSGYDAFGIPNGAKLAFSLTVTDEDPGGRAITLNQKSVLSTGGAPSAQTFFLVAGITDSAPYTSGVSLIAYNQNSPITIAYGATTTLYFASASASGTGVVSSPAIGPYGVFLLMFGQYSDNTYYSQTIPFEATYSTGATITGATVSGCAGTTYSESLQAATWNSGPAAYYVPAPATGAGTLITVGASTTSSVSFKIPAGAALGYYQLFFDDGTNIAYMTFRITC